MIDYILELCNNKLSLWIILDKILEKYNLIIEYDFLLEDIRKIKLKNDISIIIILSTFNYIDTYTKIKQTNLFKINYKDLKALIIYNI